MLQLCDFQSIALPHCHFLNSTTSAHPQVEPLDLATPVTPLSGKAVKKQKTPAPAVVEPAPVTGMWCLRKSAGVCSRLLCQEHLLQADYAIARTCCLPSHFPQSPQLSRRPLPVKTKKSRSWQRLRLSPLPSLSRLPKGR